MNDLRNKVIRFAAIMPMGGIPEETVILDLNGSQHTGQEAYDIAFTFAKDHSRYLGVGSWVCLYYTWGQEDGLLGALDGYESTGVNVELIRFDPINTKTTLIRRHIETLKKCSTPSSLFPHVSRSTYCPDCGNPIH